MQNLIKQHDLTLRIIRTHSVARVTADSVTSNGCRTPSSLMSLTCSKLLAQQSFADGQHCSNTYQWNWTFLACLAAAFCDTKCGMRAARLVIYLHRVSSGQVGAQGHRAKHGVLGISRQCRLVWCIAQRAGTHGSSPHIDASCLAALCMPAPKGRAHNMYISVAQNGGLPPSAANVRPAKSTACDTPLRWCSGTKHPEWHSRATKLRQRCSICSSPVCQDKVGMGLASCMGPGCRSSAHLQAARCVEVRAAAGGWQSSHTCSAAR